MRAVNELLNEIERLSPEGRLDPALVERLSFVPEGWEEGDENEAWLWRGKPASKASIATLAKRARESLGDELPTDLVSLLKRHDGIAVVGFEPRGAIDLELEMSLMRADQIATAVSYFRELAQNVSGPPGVMPFFRLSRDEQMYDCLHLASGAVSRVNTMPKDRPSRPAELESYPRVAASFCDWLENWLEAGFDGWQMPVEQPEHEHAAQDAVEIGDIFELPKEYGSSGEGYHWATRIEELDEGATKGKSLWVRFFTVAHTTTQAAPGALKLFRKEALEGKTAPRSLCKKVSEQRRAAILQLIDPAVRDALPGARNRP